MRSADALPWVGTGLALVSSGWAVWRTRLGDAREAMASASAQAERITVLETKVALYWEAVSRAAAAMLHSPDPHHARRDWLLENYTTLTLMERAELASMLELIQSDPDSDRAERMAAAQLLGYLAATAMTSH